MSDLAPEITAYYAAYAEESRLATGAFQLEFERTKEIFTRGLPPPPARGVDGGRGAGGGARGRGAFWPRHAAGRCAFPRAAPRRGGGGGPARRNASARSRLG